MSDQHFIRITVHPLHKAAQMRIFSPVCHTQHSNFIFKLLKLLDVVIEILNLIEVHRVRTALNLDMMLLTISNHHQIESTFDQNTAGHQQHSLDSEPPRGDDRARNFLIKAEGNNFFVVGEVECLSQKRVTQELIKLHCFEIV